MVTRGSAAPAVASASPAGRSIGGGRRAVALRPALGALLVLTAAVGTFTVAGSDEAVPRTTYLVASRALRPGDTIGTGDVTEVAIDLPAAQRDGVATDPSALRDAVVRIPVDAGALLYESALDRAPEGATGAYLELSVSLPAARAVAGRLDRGDRVQVLASDRDGTRLVADDVTVLDVDTDGGAFVRTGEIVVTLALPDAATARAVAQGAHDDGITLVRANRFGDRRAP